MVVQKTFIISAIGIVFIGFGCLGMTQAGTAAFGANERAATHCMLPGVTTALCSASPLQHIDMWHIALATLVQQGNLVLVLLALVALAFFLHSVCSPPRYARISYVLSRSVYTYYKHRTPIIHPIAAAFSDGIVHPKVF